MYISIAVQSLYDVHCFSFLCIYSLVPNNFIGKIQCFCCWKKYQEAQLLFQSLRCCLRPFFSYWSSKLSSRISRKGAAEATFPAAYPGESDTHIWTLTRLPPLMSCTTLRTQLGGFCSQGTLVNLWRHSGCLNYCFWLPALLNTGSVLRSAWMSSVPSLRDPALAIMSPLVWTQALWPVVLAVSSAKLPFACEGHLGGWTCPLITRMTQSGPGS